MALGLAAALAAPPALADLAPAPDGVARHADPSNVVLAVRTAFSAAGRSVRLAVYDDKGRFLERAVLKHQAMVNEDGLALMTLRGLRPGAYAFVAYLDQNGDGRLNRDGLLGRPKEPFVFSNGVRPKFKKPDFDEVKVEVAPGSVVLLRLDD